MTRQRELEFSDAIREHLPLMHEALQFVGHRQTRNRGTIGGSLAISILRRNCQPFRPPMTRWSRS